jgi:hypothetical protein
MVGSQIRVCRWCGAKIMFVGVLWLYAEVADVNGYCPNSNNDKHSPKI